MEEQESTLNLLELVYGLVEKLMLTVDYDRVELEDFIDGVRDHLLEVKESYNSPPPAGAEAIQSLMCEALELFDAAFEHILQFLEDEEEARLRRAVALADEANDLLGALEEVVQNNKQILNELVQA